MCIGDNEYLDTILEGDAKLGTVAGIFIGCSDAACLVGYHRVRGNRSSSVTTTNPGSRSHNCWHQQIVESMGTGNPLPKFDPARDFPHTQTFPHFYEVFDTRLPRTANDLETYATRGHIKL